jgi:histidine triad (HIT) family protein
VSVSASCVFCRIVRGEAPAHVLHEDEHTLAFLDIHPLVEGHTMVIPKAHYETLEDLPPELVGQVFETVRKVSAAMRKALGAQATTIGINNGRAAGQVVPHLHIHIVPRYVGDGGGTIHSIIHRPPQRSLDEVRDLLASAL